MKRETAADRRQRLAAEAQGGDGVEILVARQLRGGVTLERERQLVRAHAVTVVDHAHQRGAAVAQVHRDRARVGVERVLHQLLHRRGRPLDHLAGGDLVDERVGQPADAHQAPKTLLPLRQQIERLDRREVGQVEARQLLRHRVGGGRHEEAELHGVAGVGRGLALLLEARASSALARAINPAGRPASRATWMP